MKAELVGHGIDEVKWASSKSGKLRIALGHARSTHAGWSVEDVEAGDWSVWSLYTGTHDIYISRYFKNYDDARQFANSLWRSH